jgi:predicted lipoprotein with Yx(FWY)xxD motif
MRRPLLILSALVLVIALGAGAVAIASSGGSAAVKATVKTRSTSLGTILVDSKGRTLYLFEKDTRNKSKCSGACAANWPPALVSGKPTAGGKAVASRLGTTTRSGGKKQVTYAGHPLYTFVLDKNKPGSTKGEGVDAFGAEWYVVGTNGKKIEKKGDKSSTSSQSQPQPGGYGGSGY